MKIALSIAGSDSGAGAGIQADLKTFSALGVYGCTAITAITAQNTKKVADIFAIPSSLVEQQIKSVITDLPPDAIKIGMVYNREIINSVYRSLRKHETPIVLDPILAAGTGAKLLRDDSLDSLVSKLMPMCMLITPNRLEAEKIAGIKIRTVSDGIEAAKKIRQLGAKNVIIKGGHFESSSVTDLLLDNKGRLTKISSLRVKISESHGSGCNFSSAVTAYLAKGAVLEDACRMANEYVHIAIKNAIKAGRGLPVTNPLSSIYIDANRYRVIEELQAAVQEVISLDGFYKLIPETQTNFVYALPESIGISEVAGVRGRIIRVGRTAMPASHIEFGASKHMASAIIGYRRINPSFRSGINIRFSKELVKTCKRLFSISKYDRGIEPKGIKKKEGSSMSWGTMQALSKNSRADVIYHEGDVGKEPMITIFGRNPHEVADKIKAILQTY